MSKMKLKVPVAYLINPCMREKTKCREQYLCHLKFIGYPPH